MPEKEKVTGSGISRRQFIKGAGIVIGGTAVGTSVLLSACGGGETTTVTRTNTTTATTTATQTVTTTVGGGGTTQTVTTTAAGSTAYVCPYDSQQFDTLAALQAHLEAEHLGGTGMAEGTVVLNINGKARILQVEPEWSLAFVLREKLGLTGTKVGCDRGECGTCTVLVDGVTMYACMMFANECEGMAITTIEGLADGATLHPVQQAFFDTATYQCGYCTPGNIMSAVALLAKNPNPTRSEVKEALAGNLCYCIDYTRIENTILAAAGGS